jgi:hypothetical protein
MFRRFSLAAYFALVAILSATGIAEAAKGPDAAEVAVGTFIAVLIAMAFLGLMFMLKVLLGGVRSLPPEEPTTGGHH